MKEKLACKQVTEPIENPAHEAGEGRFEHEDLLAEEGRGRYQDNDRLGNGLDYLATSLAGNLAVKSNANRDSKPDAEQRQSNRHDGSKHTHKRVSNARELSSHRGDDAFQNNSPPQKSRL